MACKVTDGLFLGDADTSYDAEFLELNKVSNLINLAGRDVQNVWAAHGLVYLSYLWEDRPNFRIFSDKASDWDGSHLYPPPLGEIVEFIDGSLEHGISVLLFSQRGQGRCVLAMCAYLMCKYRWSYDKAFELILTKKPDVTLNKGFVQQLQALDKYLLTQRGGLKNTPGQTEGQLNLSKRELSRWRDWTPSYLDEGPSDEEERIVVHSYLNCQKPDARLVGAPLPLKEKRRGLKFRQVLTHVQDGSIRNIPTNAPTGSTRGCLKGTRSGTRVPVAKNTVLMTEDAKEITEAKRDTNTGADRDHYNNSNSNGNVSGMHNERGNSGMSGMGIDVGHSDEYDLYGFVGVEGAGGSGGGSPRRNSPKRTGTGAVASRPSSAPLQRGSQGVDSRFQINYNQVSDSVSGVTVTGLTVEERLQQMMRGMGMAVAGSHIHDRDRDSYSQAPTSASAAPVSASARGGNNGNTSTSASSNRPSSARDRHAGPAESKTPSDFNNPNVVDMQWESPDRAGAGRCDNALRPQSQQPRQRQQQQQKDREIEREGSSHPAPALSLYDLANMPVAPSGSGNRPVPRNTPVSTGRSAVRRPMSAQAKMEPTERANDASDPLAAFGVASGLSSFGQAQPRGGPVRSEYRPELKSSDRDRDRDRDREREKDKRPIRKVSDRLYPRPSSGPSGSGSGGRGGGSGESGDRGAESKGIGIGVGVGMGLEGRSVSSNYSAGSRGRDRDRERDSAGAGGVYRRGGGGSNASIASNASEGGGSRGSKRGTTPRKKGEAGPKGWR